MFINYEHQDNVYNITVEKKGEYYFITHDNAEYKVTAEEIKPGHLKIKLGDRIIKSIITAGEKEKYVFIDGDVFKVKNIELTGSKLTKKKDEGTLSSPISGRVVNVKVKKGEKVKKGAVLMVIEAMKMEYLIRSPYDGEIVKINFKEKDQIEIGENTVEIKKSEQV